MITRRNNSRETHQKVKNTELLYDYISSSTFIQIKQKYEINLALTVTATLFTIAKTCKQLKCQAIVEWKNMLYYFIFV